MTSLRMRAIAIQILTPTLSLLAALVIAGLMVAMMGENPFAALVILLDGAFGPYGATGYTLYYATNFIFTGLAVAVAFHAGLFNIGGEGQAMMGGIGLTLAAFMAEGLAPWLAIPLVVLGSVVFGAAWAFVPALLQATRGSHIVITTIMFNFIAASLLGYLLVGPLKGADGQMPESDEFADSVTLPHIENLIGGEGWMISDSPLNLSILVALLAAFAVWVLIWRSRFGYELRVVGQSHSAARYAGIDVQRMTVMAMALSGALAGMMGINELLGEQQRLVNGFTLGYGFVGIAVAFMGRNHPFGICLAALLFGILYQGGSELGFELGFPKDLIILVQGLIILFAGAMPNLFEGVVRRMLTPKTSAGGM